jgi:sensor domain CHASE-containing protein
MKKISLKGTIASLIIYAGLLITIWLAVYLILLSRGGIV